MNPNDSPLAEPAIGNINEVMSEGDPDLMDLRAIIKYMRAAREQWARDEEAGKKRATKAPAGSVTLASLGLSAPKPMPSVNATGEATNGENSGPSAGLMPNTAARP